MCVGIPLTTYEAFSGNHNVWPFVHVLLMFNFSAVIRTTCPKKLSHVSRGGKRIASYKCVTGFLSRVQEGLTGQGGNILNKQTCLSIGPTQLYVYCSIVYQLRAVQTCAIIGT